MKKPDLMNYFGFEVGVDFMDGTTGYGILTYDEKSDKFKFKYKKNVKEFTADQVKRVWLLKS